MKGKKILVVSNCVSYGIANSLEYLAPGFRVEAIPFTVLLGKIKDGEITGPIEADLLVISDQAINSLEQHAVSEFLPQQDRVIVPYFRFARYQPDIAYITLNGRSVKGPLGDYHSRIAFRAFEKGYSADRAAELFKREVFSKLGYLRTHEQEKANLISAYGRQGLDIRGHFTSWSRNGSFMHSLNHPRIQCLFDISREIVKQLGIPNVLDAYSEIECPIIDNLLNSAVWPVYPEIAECYGFGGHYLFKPEGSYRPMSLDEFLQSSMDTYEALSRQGTLSELAVSPSAADDALEQIL